MYVFKKVQLRRGAMCAVSTINCSVLDGVQYLSPACLQSRSSRIAIVASFHRGSAERCVYRGRESRAQRAPTVRRDAQRATRGLRFQFASKPQLSTTPSPSKLPLFNQPTRQQDSTLTSDECFAYRCHKGRPTGSPIASSS